ncbi:hypothetical protein NL676_014108 [Syzygium grande]|nr:hypothetical protein NL676_014108 [Syzygium grande]
MSPATTSQKISVDHCRNSLHRCCSFTGASFMTTAAPSPTKLLIQDEFLQTRNYERDAVATVERARPLPIWACSRLSEHGSC